MLKQAITKTLSNYVAPALAEQAAAEVLASVSAALLSDAPAAVQTAAPARKRGRPAGAKNKKAPAAAGSKRHSRKWRQAITLSWAKRHAAAGTATEAELALLTKAAGGNGAAEATT